jgi:hypothetical protein
LKNAPFCPIFGRRPRLRPSPKASAVAEGFGRRPRLRRDKMAGQREADTADKKVILFSLKCKQTLSDDKCQSVDNGNECQNLFQTNGWDIETHDRDNAFKPMFWAYKSEIRSKNKRDAYDGYTDTYELFEKMGSFPQGYFELSV